MASGIEFVKARFCEGEGAAAIVDLKRTVETMFEIGANGAGRFKVEEGFERFENGARELEKLGVCHAGSFQIQQMN